MLLQPLPYDKKLPTILHQDPDTFKNYGTPKIIKKLCLHFIHLKLSSITKHDKTE